MVTFVIALLLIAGGITCAAGGAFTKQGGWVAGGVVAAIVGILVMFFGGIRSVPVKSVGVLTSFGHVDGELRPGFHWAADWTSANILDETIQTTSFKGGFDKDGINCVPTALNVRIGGQQHGCLDATIQWQVKNASAGTLFKNYDTSGNVQGAIKNAVVVREFESVVNQVMGDYNPIYDVAANGEAGNSQFSTFGPKIEALMRTDIGSEIVVRSVLVPFLHYDGPTQTRLNGIQQQYAEAAIAKEQIVINQETATANNAIRASVTNDPAVLEQECLSLVQTAIKSNYQLPAGFNCTGGGSVLALPSTGK